MEKILHIAANEATATTIANAGEHISHGMGLEQTVDLVDRAVRLPGGRSRSAAAESPEMACDRRARLPHPGHPRARFGNRGRPNARSTGCFELGAGPGQPRTSTSPASPNTSPSRPGTWASIVPLAELIQRLRHAVHHPYPAHGRAEGGRPPAPPGRPLDVAAAGARAASRTLRLNTIPTLCGETMAVRLLSQRPELRPAGRAGALWVRNWSWPNRSWTQAAA